jgi:hypothetical protein
MPLILAGGSTRPKFDCNGSANAQLEPSVMAAAMTIA